MIEVWLFFMFCPSVAMSWQSTCLPNSFCAETKKKKKGTDKLRAFDPDAAIQAATGAETEAVTSEPTEAEVPEAVPGSYLRLIPPKNRQKCVDADSACIEATM